MRSKTMNPELKRLTGMVKAVSLEDSGPGTMEGYANVIGVVDSYGERTMPGAFAQDISEFVQKGYLLIDHEWEVESCIGYILEAREDQTGLYFKAEFHSTPQAQDMRRKIGERIAAGKEVGLSIGYWVIEAETITEDGESIRELRRVLVKEVSLVVAQANAPSMVTSVKTTRPDQHEALLKDAEAYLERVKDINDLGRPDAWKSERAGELLTLAQKFSEAAAGLAPEEPEPTALEADDDDGDALAALALLELDLILN